MSRRIRVSGHVQGVWYRGWTVDTARALGLSGWVRNRRDGSVDRPAAEPDPLHPTVDDDPADHRAGRSG